MKDVIKTINIKYKEQIYSFVKTYFTVFLALYLYGIENGKEMFDTIFILEIAKVSLLSVIRNIYKILTEK